MPIYSLLELRRYVIKARATIHPGGYEEDT